MDATVLLVHGWGLDPAFFTPLAETLGGMRVLRRGPVFDGSIEPAPASGPLVAVGHSLGLLWLLHERPMAWNRLIAINGFTRFCAASDFPDGVPPRLLRRMSARLAGHPDLVRRDFLERCGLPENRHPAWDDADAPALADGLRALEDWDCRDRAERVDLVLAGRQDPIVPAAMTSACFPSTRIEWQDGGHLLPLTDPGWCAEKIRRVVETLT